MWTIPNNIIKPHHIPRRHPETSRERWMRSWYGGTSRHCNLRRQAQCSAPPPPLHCRRAKGRWIARRETRGKKEQQEEERKRKDEQQVKKTGVIVDSSSTGGKVEKGNRNKRERKKTHTPENEKRGKSGEESGTTEGSDHETTEVEAAEQATWRGTEKTASAEGKATKVLGIDRTAMDEAGEGTKRENWENE